MRRTTLWAVFTSMNQQQAARRAAHRSDDEPEPRVEPAADEPGGNAQAEPLTRPAPDTRRDRVELM